MLTRFDSCTLTSALVWPLASALNSLNPHVRVPIGIAEQRFHCVLLAQGRHVTDLTLAERPPGTPCLAVDERNHCLQNKEDNE
jgi:hypothetical protein